MEMILKVVDFSEQITHMQRPKKAFMNDVTLLSTDKQITQSSLLRLDELVRWSIMFSFIHSLFLWYVSLSAHVFAPLHVHEHVCVSCVYMDFLIILSVYVSFSRLFHLFTYLSLTPS